MGLSATAIGWLIGSQSLATVLTRHQAGTLSDARGARVAVLCGLPLAVLAAGCYLLSVLRWPSAWLALPILVIGRLLLGLGESLFITGVMSWGISRLGAARTGQVMAWQGIAMYAAMGAGAPLGLAVQRGYGFGGVAIAAMIAPLVALAVAWRLPAAAASGATRAAFHRVLTLIWRPGLVLLFATMPFAVMATFLALHYASRGWQGAGMALGGFGAGFVIVRLLFAHLPARYGGARVAAVSVTIEAVGQLLIWQAPGAAAACAGAVLTGVGFSLVFPAMGVEATRRLSPETRGRAVGNFIAFFDIAVGASGPIVGLAAHRFGYDSAFLFGALAACTALGIVMLESRLPAPGADDRRVGVTGR